MRLLSLVAAVTMAVSACLSGCLSGMLRCRTRRQHPLTGHRSGVAVLRDRPGLRSPSHRLRADEQLSQSTYDWGFSIASKAPQK